MDTIRERSRAEIEALAKLTTADTIRCVGEGKRGDPYRYYKPVSADEEERNEEQFEPDTRDWEEV